MFINLKDIFFLGWHSSSYNKSENWFGWALNHISIAFGIFYGARTFFPGKQKNTLVINLELKGSLLEKTWMECRLVRFASRWQFSKQLFVPKFVCQENKMETGKFKDGGGTETCGCWRKNSQYI